VPSAYAGLLIDVGGVLTTDIFPGLCADVRFLPEMTGAVEKLRRSGVRRLRGEPAPGEAFGMKTVLHSPDDPQRTIAEAERLFHVLLGSG
jgi:hypothetical protein